MTSTRGGGLEGRRVLITGAARGIGAALARRLHGRGARVALAGLEEGLLAEVASSCGDAPWRSCDVSERAQVEATVAGLLGDLGGLDVVVANAGIGAQMALVGGDPRIMGKTLAVNTLGSYYTVAAAGPHIGHGRGYALLVSSAAAGLHPPLMGAYCASKAAVEAIGDCLRIELRPSGARVGVAYFAEIETDMTARGMRTEAASHIVPPGSPFAKASPILLAVDALERGIAHRSSRVFAPAWVRAAMPARMLVQRALDVGARPARVAEALRIALTERAPFTTTQPEEADRLAEADA
jgi:NAD(P)-dependent dehydrogenase (short-subunit alcohol dehydrogenase family)